VSNKPKVYNLNRTTHTGKVIYDWRCAHDIGLKDMAAEAGISDKTLCKIEMTGKIKRVDTAEKLADYMGISPSYLLFNGR